MHEPPVYPVAQAVHPDAVVKPVAHVVHVFPALHLRQFAITLEQS